MMKNKSNLSATSILALLILLLLCICCKADASNPFLEKLLSAANEREFSEALMVYGTLASQDVPDVVKATEASSSRRRKNAAMVLSLCREENCGEAQLKVVRKTKDEVVWAMLVEAAAKTDEKILRERPELLTKALDSDNGDVVAHALRVGLKINADGIQEKVLKMLDSKDPKILEVVLNNLSPAMAKQEAARLARMLEDEKTYGSIEMEIALALVRAEDQQYDPNIKAFVARLKKANSDHMFFNEAFISEDKQMVDLLWKMAQTKDGDALTELRDQAYDVLCRRSWAPSPREPVTVELMELTLGYLKKASPDTNPRAHMNDEQYGAASALDLIAFVHGGERKSENYLYGKDAIAFTEKWLKEHQAATKSGKGTL